MCSASSACDGTEINSLTTTKGFCRYEFRRSKTRRHQPNRQTTYPQARQITNRTNTKLHRIARQARPRITPPLSRYPFRTNHYAPLSSIHPDGYSSTSTQTEKLRPPPVHPPTHPTHQNNNPNSPVLTLQKPNRTFQPQDPPISNPPTHHAASTRSVNSSPSRQLYLPCHV